jgi:hypothetical protein
MEMQSSTTIAEEHASELLGPPAANRHRLPEERPAITHHFVVGGHEGYLTVGLYPNGQPGEIFIRMAKEGSTIAGLMECFGTVVSVSLQHGVPLRCFATSCRTLASSLRAGPGMGNSAMRSRSWITFSAGWNSAFSLELNSLCFPHPALTAPFRSIQGRLCRFRHKDLNLAMRQPAALAVLSRLPTGAASRAETAAGRAAAPEDSASARYGLMMMCGRRRGL